MTRRLLRGLVVLSIGLFVAAGGSYAGTAIGLRAGSSPAKPTPARACDVDGVRVSYSISYDRVVSGYSVDAVHVLDIAAACQGQVVQVVLKGAGDAALAGGTGKGVVDAGSADLGLGTDVSAAAVRSVDVALGGSPAALIAHAPHCGRGARSRKMLRGSNGPDCLYGSRRADVIVGRGGRDLVTGRGGNDRLAGGAGPDLLSGGSGNDTLNGGRGNDSLDGGSGNDVLHGGRGNDVLRGGSGRDVCIGGPGKDRFTGCEVIRP